MKGMSHEQAVEIIKQEHCKECEEQYCNDCAYAFALDVIIEKYQIAEINKAIECVKNYCQSQNGCGECVLKNGKGQCIFTDCSPYGWTPVIY